MLCFNFVSAAATAPPSKPTKKSTQCMQHCQFVKRIFCIFFAFQHSAFCLSVSLSLSSVSSSLSLLCSLQYTSESSYTEPVAEPNQFRSYSNGNELTYLKHSRFASFHFEFVGQESAAIFLENGRRYILIRRTDRNTHQMLPQRGHWLFSIYGQNSCWFGKCSVSMCAQNNNWTFLSRISDLRLFAIFCSPISVSAPVPICSYTGAHRNYFEQPKNSSLHAMHLACASVHLKSPENGSNRQSQRV